MSSCLVHPWVKQVEKFSKLSDVRANNIKLVAYNGSRDVVSNFLARYMVQFPNATWDMIKMELSQRFSTIIDPSHASCLLRRIHQKESESVQSYAERLIDLAEQDLRAWIMPLSKLWLPSWWYISLMV